MGLLKFEVAYPPPPPVACQDYLIVVTKAIVQLVAVTLVRCLLVVVTSATGQVGLKGRAELD